VLTCPPTHPPTHPGFAWLLRWQVGDELKRSIRDDILRLISAKTYRGTRHALGLPARGQRTSTNAQTARKFKRHLMYDVK
jgi:small subunit ribosomal protein S13